MLRSYCGGTYFKEDAGKILFGFAHNHARPWGMRGISEEFCFDSLPFLEDDVMDVLELAMNRVPLLKETGIRTFFNGPESYSYDGRFILGEAPDIKGYFILGGVNSTGIQSGSGAGRALAQWIIDGHRHGKRARGLYADAKRTRCDRKLGLEFVCKVKKPIPFIGRDAYLERKAANKDPFLCSVKLNDPVPILHHNEPVLRDGKVAGYVTSGAFGQTVGAAVGLCLVSLLDEETEKSSLENGTYTVMVEGKAIAADVSLMPFYDPKSTRMFS